MPRLSRTVVRNSAFGVGSQFAIKLLSFGFSVLVVRHLGAAEYGQYAAALAFGAIFVFLADLGLSPYAVREVARRRDRPGGEEEIRALYGNLLTLRLLLSLATAVLLIAAAWLTGRPAVMVGAIALGAVGLVIHSVYGASEAVAAGSERLDLPAAARVLYQFLFVLLGAAALWFGLGYYGLIFANLAAIAAMAWMGWRVVGQLGIRPTRAAISCWPALLRASVPFGVIGFTLGLSYRFDSVLLSVYRSDVETGYYNAAYNLVFSATVLSNAINTALYPSLARDAASSVDGLWRTYERALRYLMVIALPIAAGIWAVADELVPFLFTTSYLPAAAVLRIVIWAVPLMFASEFLGYVVVIRGDEGRVARSVAISTGLNVALNLILVPRFGLTAAALMTVATELVLVGQYLWLLRAELRRLDLGRAVGRPLAAALIMSGLALALRDLPLVAVAALAALAYAALLLALGVAGRDELHFLRSLRRPAPAAQSA